MLPLFLLRYPSAQCAWVLSCFAKGNAASKRGARRTTAGNDTGNACTDSVITQEVFGEDTTYKSSVDRMY